jgi:addiction module HigA family antidote
MPMQPVHPGEVIDEDILNELGLTPRQLAVVRHVPTGRVSDIVRGKRPIKANFALRLAKWLGASPRFWLDLRTRSVFEPAILRYGEAIKRTVRPRESAA